MTPIPRCTCDAFEQEPVPELPICKRCTKCKRWTSLEIITQEDSDLLNKAFADMPALQKLCEGSL